MKAFAVRIAVPLAGLLVLAAMACQKSETIAPDGSTITLTANPAQVILGGTPATQLVDVNILATIRNSIGVPLPGQDVRFTTTSGTLTPPGGQPISTDDLGNATCTLTNATVGPQITATSGKATANLTLTAATGNLAQITLSPTPLNLTNCTNSFDLTATALGPSGELIAGVTIFFEFVSTTGVSGTFTNNGGVSDVNGVVTSTLQIDSQSCNNSCQSGKDCSTSIRAKDKGGLVISNLVPLNDQVP